MSSQEAINQTVFEALYPKAAANYLSKLALFQSMPYPDILAALVDGSVSFPKRLSAVGDQIGAPLEEGVQNELTILDLSLRGKEDDIEDDRRKALYRRVDANQVPHSHDQRNLAYFLEGGVHVNLRADTKALLSQAVNGDTRNVPIIEKVKSEKLFGINGYGSSKVLHLLHDVMDHPWLFKHLTDEGVFKTYSDFLESIDLSNEGFLYSRQAELVAGIGFGSRRWEFASHTDEHVLLTTEHISEILGNSSDERIMRASERFKTLDIRHQAQILFVLENAIIQTADERRRFGSVKQKNTQTGVRTPMNLLDPLYVAFVIDTVTSIQNYSEYSTLQVATSIGVENMLGDIAQGDIPSQTYHMLVPNLAQLSNRSFNIPDSKWFMDNYQQLTSYNKSVETKPEGVS
jgi:hypothetical protein